MLFNSFEFILVFLPSCIVGYFLLTKFGFYRTSNLWLVIASLVFYSWWNIYNLPIILGSVCFNYIVGKKLTLMQFHNRTRKFILAGSIVVNLGVLGFFKYYNFFISNVNHALDVDFGLLKFGLPLAISFFTFQQIGYLVECYRKETGQESFLSYSLFVTFFPHLIAGPIIQHNETIPQYESIENKSFKGDNFILGVFIFFVGLSKKVIIADNLAVFATKGFESAPKLQLIEAWATSISYTFQLYFDFSGYTDMAIGLALIFNIVLPMNFNSPYKAVNIQDFWRRWHITLGKFLTKYVYYSLGGNRKGKCFTYINLLLVFVISGLWHGAGWNFVFWGFLHGLGIVTHRVWNQFTSLKMNKIVAWLITFNFVNVAWVFFRADKLSTALSVLKGMLGFNGITLPEKFIITPFLTKLGVSFGYYTPNLGGGKYLVLTLLLVLFIILAIRNSNIIRETFVPNMRNSFYLSFIIVVCFVLMYSFVENSPFVYFKF